MNPQVSAFLRNSLISVGAVVAAKFGLTPDPDILTTLAGLATSLVGFLWSAWGHRRDQVVSAASALAHTPGSGVIKVLTTPELANSPRFKDDAKVVSHA